MADKITKQFSFYQLLKGDEKKNLKQYKIVIPIIQRDYAQGRLSEKANEVRDDFLQALHDYIVDPEKKSHDLDFVYGSSEKASERTSFIPLDGQQRLTTLFLLHWYLMQRSNDEESKYAMKKALTLEDGSSFLYMTRQSSTDFCNKLVDEVLDFSCLEKNNNSEDSISDTLKNEPWFVPSWSYDPTVQSMLVMLEAIHKQFHDDDCTTLLKRLMDENSPAITFIFMDLDEYNLNDDLYIKMNSRGKPLSSFENFKAKFEQYIGKEKDKLQDLLKTIKEENADTMYTDSVKEYFSFNIDTKWTNLFWAYCKEGLELNGLTPKEMESRLEGTIDAKMANFIRVIFTNSYALINGSNKDNVSSVCKDYLWNQSKDFLSFNNYKELGIISSDCISYLVRTLDLLSNGTNKIRTLLDKDATDNYFNEERIVKTAMNSVDGLTLPERVRFHAYILYRVLFGSSEVGRLKEFMRIVYNLTYYENTSISSGANLSSAIISINNVVNAMKEDNNPSALEYFASLGDKYSSKVAFFNRDQLKEEVIKANLLLKSANNDIDWKTAIVSAERVPYFNGQIGFLLYFAGIEDYFDKNKNCNWSEEEDKTHFEEFIQYLRIGEKIFEEDSDGTRVLSKDALFERTMLAIHPDYIGDLKGKGTMNFLSSSYDTWRDNLRKKTIIRHYVKDLFDLINPSKDINSELNRIIDEHPAKFDWQEALIKDPECIKWCQNGKVNIYDGGETEADGVVILISKTNKTNSDAELYTSFLWDYYYPRISAIIESFKGIRLEYKTCKENEDMPHIQGEFSFNGLKYFISLYAHSINRKFEEYYFVIAGKGTVLPKEITTCLTSKYDFQNEGDKMLKLISEASTFSDIKVLEEFDAICKAINDLI